MRVLWDALQSSTSLLIFPFFPCHFFFLSLSPLFFSSIEASFLSFLSKKLSWWWSFFFHGLFPSGWCLLSPLLLYLPLHLHGGKSPLKDLIEPQRFNLHRSFSSKLPSQRVGPNCGAKDLAWWWAWDWQDIWSSPKGVGRVFFYLAENNVLFEGILLKPSMVTPGAESKDNPTP